ncbi:hypothetical protein PRECH8_03900 [Insulibacter thermoxylanivorax]|uniref:Protein CcmA, bactofilin family n=1 Tax=Insulibacter thermoxylanivorax TaxID=2749268 RepID=A0A916QCM5_9BACL|nr:polymer-forming cytoskeletal protein [Insulibacter thermoxylanivorax]GFR37094.1 hypothetical protein PRECH8_03900 [Insulibacter thermoxylanivorax]
MRKVNKLKEMKTQTTDTLIGAGTVVEGKLHSNASLRIDGSVRGDITCKGDLYIGENAVLQSDVQAANIYHAGKIHGTVTTTGTLHVSKSGKIYGDLNVAKIQIAEGAVFEGTIIMRTEVAKQASAVSQPKNDKVKVVK